MVNGHVLNSERLLISDLAQGHFILDREIELMLM
jgi:hypothetical protein